jgi:hypothetical protein
MPDWNDRDVNGLTPTIVPTTTQPSDEQLERWFDDGVCMATDGCWVEPDGTCPHGHPSWLLYLGMI